MAPEPVQRTDERLPDSAFAWAPDAEGDGESDGEGDWVTAENIGRLGQAAEKSEDVRLACATADYSVQNVLLQVGLPVLSVDGYRIRNVKLWAKICRGCQAFTRDSERLFCPKCGNDTLERVSYTLDEAGQPVICDHRRRGPRLKGTVYSLPAPKGGRAKPLILCEDQLLMGGLDKQLKHEQKQFDKERREADPFNPDAVYGFGGRSGRVRGSGYPQPVVGVGRKNPNQKSFKWGRK